MHKSLESQKFLFFYHHSHYPVHKTFNLFIYLFDSSRKTFTPLTNKTKRFTFNWIFIFVLHHFSVQRPAISYVQKWRWWCLNKLQTNYPNMWKYHDEMQEKRKQNEHLRVIRIGPYEIVFRKDNIRIKSGWRLLLERLFSRYFINGKHAIFYIYINQIFEAEDFFTTHVPVFIILSLTLNFRISKNYLNVQKY